MFGKDLMVYLDGEYLKLEDADISVMTHSLHYGSGVFEGVRAYNTKNGTGILYLNKHIDRLFYSAETMGLVIPFSKEEIKEACLEVLRKNNLKSAYIRPLVFFDHSTLGLKINNSKTRVLIAGWEWGKYLAESVKIKVSSYRRISEKTTVSDAKISGHYANSILASTEVQKEGFDEALLLDHSGAVAEGPGENIFFIKDKKLFTPKIGKILPGITREMIMQIAKSLNYEVIEKEIFPNELNDFEGAFFTGTAAEVTVISEIVLESEEKIEFNNNSPQEIKEKFFGIIKGEEVLGEDWFSYI